LLVLDEGGLGSYWDGRVGVQVGERAGVLLVLVSDSTQLLCNEHQEQVRILASILERAASGSEWETEKLASPPSGRLKRPGTPAGKRKAGPLSWEGDLRGRPA